MGYKLSRLLLILSLIEWVIGDGSEILPEKTPPNIIIILADDLGWNDVGFHGMKDIPTPNIDALAMDSIIMNNYYVQPLCTPSRASLMTGLYPIHTGTQHYVIRTAEGWGLPLQLQTLPQSLNKLNYVSRIVGKWHLGFHKSSYTPLARGFYSHYGFWPGALDFFTHRAATLINFNDTTNYPYNEPRDKLALTGKAMRNNLISVDDREGEYLTHVLNEKAVEVIRNHNQSKPLFLYLAHHAVHRGNPRLPIRGPPGTDELFKYIKNETRRNFAGVLKALDDSIGDIVKALDKMGMLKNSIIVFSTDNGAEATTFFTSGGSNYPLRGQKYTAWEGGIRGISTLWSPKLKPRISEQLFHLVDWMPTLYRAAGGDPVNLGPIDGIDAWNALVHDQPSPRQELLLSLDPVWNLAAIREGKFKLVCGEAEMPDVNGWYDVMRDNETSLEGQESKLTRMLKEAREAVGTTNLFQANRHQLPIVVDCGNEIVNKSCFPKQQPCLFDLEADPCERNNLFEVYPKIAQRMISRLLYYQSTSIPLGNKPSDYMANPNFHNGHWSSWMDLDETLNKLVTLECINGSDKTVQWQLEVSSDSVRSQVRYLTESRNFTSKNNSWSPMTQSWTISGSSTLGAFLGITLNRLLN